MNLRLLFCIVLLCTTLSNIFAADSCLYIQPDSMSQDWQHTNRDSVALDTCSSSSTYGHWYSKRYEVHFRVNAFHLGYGAPDSVMIVHWEVIDTVYGALRDSFESIYNTWGPFYFQKVYPQDTNHSYETFKMIFDEYLLADGGVLNALDDIWTDGLVEISFNTPIHAPNKVYSDVKGRLSWTIKDKKLTIRLPQLSVSALKVIIFDLIGRNMRSESPALMVDSDYVTSKIDLQSLIPGTYLCFIDQTQLSFLFVVH